MQTRAEKTKAKIFKAALKEFTDKEFNGTTVDTIAARAGVNKQRIYAYYKSKDALYSEILRQSFMDVGEQEKVFLKLRDQNIPDLGRIIMKHYITAHDKYPHLWRLIAWENLEGGRHTKVLKGIKVAAFDHIRKLYRKGQQQGIYKKTVSFETFMFVIASITFFLYSNKHTLTQSHNINLYKTSIRKKVIKESLAFLNL